MFLNKVYWLTGLLSSGKTTIANETKKLLKEQFFNKVVILDGDDLRLGINNDLGFSTEDRAENIRRTAEIAKLFIRENYIVLCSLVSPTAELRQIARNIIGNRNFIEVFIDCSLMGCANRDVKGLYKKAFNGDIKNLTGVNEKYEKPENPDLIINTESSTINEAVTKLYIKIING